MPFRWKKPTRIFVNSMSDLFHDEVSSIFLDKVFAVMALNPHHTFMVLTKRPERMLEYLSRKDTDEAIGWAETMIYEEVGKLPAGVYHGPAHRRLPLANVWLGVTAENQEMADKRIPLLLQCPAALRFISIEPMLGRIRLDVPMPGPDLDQGGGATICQPWMIHSGIDWVICGGESGHHARPVHPDWVRSLRDQCASAGVPFLFKQWGEWLPAKQDKWGNVEFCDQNTMPHDGFLKLKTEDIGDGFIAFRFGKKSAGRLLDGKEYMEFPGG